MASVRELELKVLDWETRYILESLAKEMQRLKVINESSTDEDEVADAGNDYIELSGLYERLSSEAISQFGPKIIK